jgi:hypothetical protein
MRGRLVGVGPAWCGAARSVQPVPDGVGVGTQLTLAGTQLTLAGTHSAVVGLVL